MGGKYAGANRPSCLVFNCNSIKFARWITLVRVLFSIFSLELSNNNIWISWQSSISQQEGSQILEVLSFWNTSFLQMLRVAKKMKDLFHYPWYLLAGKLINYEVVSSWIRRRWAVTRKNSKWDIKRCQSNMRSTFQYFSDCVVYIIRINVNYQIKKLSVNNNWEIKTSGSSSQSTPACSLFNNLHPMRTTIVMRFSAAA